MSEIPDCSYYLRFIETLLNDRLDMFNIFRSSTQIRMRLKLVVPVKALLAMVVISTVNRYSIIHGASSSHNPSIYHYGRTCLCMESEGNDFASHCRVSERAGHDRFCVQNAGGI